MKKHSLLLLLAIFGILGYSQAQQGSRMTVQDAPNQAGVSGYAHDRVTVKFKNGVNPIFTERNGRIVSGIAGLDALDFKYHLIKAVRISSIKSQVQMYSLRFAGNIDVQTAVKEYQQAGLCDFAEPDYKLGVSTGSVTPNDPYFVYQYGSYNNGTFTYGSVSAISGRDIDMKLAWGITTGSSSVTVAVIDAGARMGHPEFAGRVWANTSEIAGNSVDDDGNGYVDDVQGWNFSYDSNDPTDDHGHGTNVAGIIGANGNNSVGYAGVDWNCKLMMLKALDSNGSGNTGITSEAIYYATDNGAKVINMSLGGSGYSAGLQTAIDYAYAHGVTCIAAMGNSNTSTPHYPAAMNHIIAVGATRPNDTRATFSNYGSHNSVVAPGEAIFGLYHLSDVDYTHGMSGTSQATPHVAGIASLLLAQDGTRTHDQIKAILEGSAEDQVGNPAEDVAGFDTYYGHGRVNAYAALTFTECTLPAITGTKTVCTGSTTTLANTTTGGSWSSSNTSIASVGVSSGVVSGVAAGTATISYVVGTCTVTTTVTVNTVPGTISGSSNGCIGSTFTLSNSVSGGTWTSSATGTATVGSSTGVVTGIASGPANITYTNSCGFSVKAITINAIPSAITGTAAVCVGSSTTLANSTTGGTWVSSMPSVASVGLTSGIVTGGIAGTTTITYTAPTTCRVTRVVTVNALPASIGGGASACTGGTTTLTNATTGGTWSSGTTSVATIGTSGIVTGVATGTSIISYTLSTGCRATIVVSIGTTTSITGTASVCIGSVTSLSASGTGTWTSGSTGIATVGSATGVVTGVGAGTSIITFSLGDGCKATQVVTVNALPASITGTASVCSGANTTLSNTTAGGTWSSSNTSVATVGSSIGAVTGISAGTATIIYTLSTGCSRSVIVTVNAAPSVSGFGYVCASSTLTLTGTPSGGTWVSSATTVATVATTGVVTGVAGGTAIITYTAPGGCKANGAVTVNPLPAAITGTASVCSGSVTTLASTTSGGSWFSSNDSVATAGIVSGHITGVSAGTAVITYMLYSGCKRTTVVTVNAAPASIGGSLSLCAGTSTTLTNAVSGGTWTSGTASVASIGSATGVLNGLVAGTSRISYTMAGSCRATAIVTVMALPANITGTASVCAGSVTTLVNTTTGGIWISSMPSVATVGSTGIVSGSIAGTTTVSYILGTGCYKSVVVTVNASPSSIEGMTTVCAGSTTSLANATSGGTWFSNNTLRATVSSAGVVTGVAAGTATISYTIAGGCRSTVIVTVNALPVAIGGTMSACVGSNSTLTNTTTGGMWSVNDTTKASIVSTTGVVTGLSAGTTVVTYTLPTGCFKTAVFTVNALPASITGVGTLCVGTTTSLSSATTPAVSWTTSTPAVATVTSAGVVNGVSAGTARITYTIGNGCKTTTVVTVNALPGAIAGALKACPGTTTTLSNTTGGGVWNSGNTAVATIDSVSGVVTGIIPGTTIITYTVATGCKKTAIVTINPLPSAIAGTGVVCAGSTTALSNTGGGTWSSGSTSVATVSGTGLITGVSAGTALITYTLSTGCYATKEVTVNALPAAITGTATLCVSNTTTLYSEDVIVTSIGGTGTWSSGNVAVATVGSSTGIVTGVAAGTANITFTNTNGCRVTTVVTVSAFAPITGTMSACVGMATTLANTTTGGTWSSADTTITIGSTSGIVTGVSSGTASVTYTLGSGCIRTATVTINVAPTSITGATIVCAGSTTSLFSVPTGGTWTSSAPSVASIGSATGVLTGVAAGAANITYTVGAGCRVTTTISVNPLPAAITGTITACVGATTTLANTTTGGLWTSANTSVATIGSTGVVTGVSAGTAVISYQALSTGCIRTTTVTINATPTAIVGTMSVCVGSTTTLADSVSGGTWSSSNSLTASVGVSSGVVTGVAAGVVNITYSIGTCRTVSSFTVNALPAAITGPSTACVMTPITFSSATTGGTWAANEEGFVEISETMGLTIGYAAGVETISYILPTGCMRTKVVTFNATPSITSGLSSLCVGQPDSLVADITGGTWSSSNASVATIGSATGSVMAVSAGSVTFTYTLGTGCQATMDVTVNALPVISGTASVLVGATTSLSATPGFGTWYSFDFGIASVGSSSGVVTGVAAGTATIMYGSPAGCFTTTVVTVNPLGTDIIGTLSVCAGSTTSLSNAVTGGTWSSANDTIASVDASGVVTGNMAGTVMISYTLPSSEVVTAVVTVNPIPSIIASVTLCESATTTASATPTGGTWSSSNTDVFTIGSSSGVVTAVNNGEATIVYTSAAGCIGFSALEVYNLPEISGTLATNVGLSTGLEGSPFGGTWSSSNDSIATVNSVGSVTGVSTGTVTITYTATTGCSVTVVVTVNAAISGIAGTTVVCAGSTTTLSHSTPGGTWATSDSSAATVSSTGVVTGVAAGTATISYTLPSSIVVTAEVIVNAVPTDIYGTAAVCSGSTTVLFDTTAGGTWSSSNATIAAVDPTGVVTGGTSGAAIITYMLSTGCYKTVIATVNALPTAITGATGICVGSTSVLTSSTGGAWSSSDTTIATVITNTSISGLVTGVSDGTAFITYTLSTGCSRVTEVTINTTPSAISGSTSVCIGGSEPLSSASTGGTWSSSNTVIATVGSSTGVFTGAAAGTATITYTLGGSCRTTAVVTVNALPSAITGTGIICVGATTSLSSATTGGVWSTSDTTASVGASTGVVTGLAPGTATITYTASTGCSRTSVVTINSLPTSISGSLSICIGNSSTLSSTPSGGTWSSSNTAVANIITLTGVVTGGSAGAATITYTAPGGCKITAAINVNGSPASITGLSSVCAGANITLANATSGGVWTSANDTFATAGSSTGVVTGVAGGTVRITYTTGTGCYSTKLVTVNAAPAAITGTASICIGSTTTLASATGSPVSWLSSTPAVATINSSTAVVTGVSAGTTIITYTIGSGCTTTRIVTVNSTPATITGPSGVCNGSTITLANTVSGGVWSSLSSNVSVVGSTGEVTGLTTGTAIITYTMGASCTKTKTVTINGAPAAISGYKTACIGLTTLLSNTTSGAWVSSDTLVAKVTTGASNSTVTGMSAGTATITYTLASTGCSSTTVVTVIATPPAITGSGNVCVLNSTTLANATAGGTWSSSNTAIATVGSTGIVTGTSIAGNATISYNIGANCRVTTLVTVRAIPNNISGPTALCIGGVATYTNTSTGGVWSSSNTAAATIVTGSPASYGTATGVAGGVTTLSYTTAPSCYKTYTVTVAACRGVGGNSTTEIGDVAAGNTVSVFPNPTSGTFTLNTQGSGVFYIYSLEGRELAKQEITEASTVINMPQGIAQGVYMCKFIGNNGNEAMVRLIFQQ
jgi:uncharacterized protein YjdB